MTTVRADGLRDGAEKDRGDVALHLTAAVAVGALPGSLLGARLSQRVEARSLKIIMAVVLLLVGLRMALEAQ